MILVSKKDLCLNLNLVVQNSNGISSSETVISKSIHDYFNDDKKKKMLYIFDNVVESMKTLNVKYLREI